MFGIREDALTPPVADRTMAVLNEYEPYKHKKKKKKDKEAARIKSKKRKHDTEIMINSPQENSESDNRSDVGRLSESPRKKKKHHHKEATIIKSKERKHDTEIMTDSQQENSESHNRSDVVRFSESSKKKKKHHHKEATRTESKERKHGTEIMTDSQQENSESDNRSGVVRFSELSKKKKKHHHQPVNSSGHNYPDTYREGARRELPNSNHDVAEIVNRTPEREPHHRDPSEVTLLPRPSTSASGHSSKEREERRKGRKKKRDMSPVDLPAKSDAYRDNFAMPNSRPPRRKVKHHIMKDAITEALNPPFYVDEGGTSDDSHNADNDTFTFSETDPESVDTDYPDELYHLPSDMQHRTQGNRKRVQFKVKTAGAKVIEAVVEKELAGLLAMDDNQLFGPSACGGSIPCNISGGGRIPGFQEHWHNEGKDFENVIFRFPHGEGVPPEEIEEIPDELNYWLNFRKTMPDGDVTEEEIENEVIEKIEMIQDYFRRLEAGQLTEEELQDVRPSDFRGPYFPTPKQLNILETLDIQVTWPLSTLHSFSMNYTGMVTDIVLRNNGMPYDSSHCSWEEAQIILRNWIRFQKEYRFYDLRPLISSKTARILGSDGNYSFEKFHYIDKTNYKHFLLYLGQDLPKRTLSHIRYRINHIMTCLRDNRMVVKREEVTCRELAQMEFVFRRFGVAFYAVDLIIDGFNKHQLGSVFQRFLFQKDVKIRTGFWTEAEKNRLKLGLKKVHGVRSLEEAGKLKRINWKKVFCYVRTRKYNSYRTRLQYLIANPSATDTKEKKTAVVKMIKLIYNSDIDCYNSIDWNKVARILGHQNPMLLYEVFSYQFRKIPYMERRTFEDAIQHMYRVMLPRMIDPLDDPSVYCLEANQHWNEHEGEKIDDPQALRSESE